MTKEEIYRGDAEKASKLTSSDRWPTTFIPSSSPRLRGNSLLSPCLRGELWRVD